MLNKENIKRLHKIHENIKTGYTEYGIYFWIISLSVIIGGFFHLAGIGALIFTLIFFYYLGKGHHKILNEQPQL